MDLEIPLVNSTHFLVYSLKSPTTFLWVGIFCLKERIVGRPKNAAYLGRVRIILFLCDNDSENIYTIDQLDLKLNSPLL